MIKKVSKYLLALGFVFSLATAPSASAVIKAPPFCDKNPPPCIPIDW